MPYAGGISAQLMVAAETTPGTAVTVTQAYEILDESFQNTPTYLDDTSLKAGIAFQRVSRTVIARKDATAGWSMRHFDQGHMGLLWKQLLGSTITTPTVIGATTAFKQIHTPATHDGMGMTCQVGRPQGSGPTVQPFTYNGTKFTGWEFSCQDGQFTQLKLSGDAWTETTATALAVPSYTAGAGVFVFADANNTKLGGTVTTTAGETSISGGVAATSVIKGVTITGSTGMAVERYGLGNAGVKKEQFQNAIPTITGSFDTEFFNRTELYDLFANNTTTALQIDFSHGDAGGGNAYLLSFIFPAVKFKAGQVNVSGPDLLPLKVDWQAYDDESGTNPVMQVKLVSKDTTL